MDLKERIIKYVLQHYPLSLTTLEGIVVSKGFTQSELYAALDEVHRDKRLQQTTKGGDVWYQPALAKVASPTPHLDWVNNNYMRPDHCEHGIENTSCEHCMPFPDMNFDHLRLKTHKERMAYKAAASGRPVHMLKHYGRRS